MATYTISNTGGNFNATASWIGGIIPTSADTVLASATSGPLTLVANVSVAGCDFRLYTSTLNLQTFLMTVATTGGTSYLGPSMSIVTTNNYQGGFSTAANGQRFLSYNLFFPVFLRALSGSLVIDTYDIFCNKFIISTNADLTITGQNGTDVRTINCSSFDCNVGVTLNSGTTPNRPVVIAVNGSLNPGTSAFNNQPTFIPPGAYIKMGGGGAANPRIMSVGASPSLVLNTGTYSLYFLSPLGIGPSGIIRYQSGTMMKPRLVVHGNTTTGWTSTLRTSGMVWDEIFIKDNNLNASNAPNNGTISILEDLYFKRMILSPQYRTVGTTGESIAGISKQASTLTFTSPLVGLTASTKVVGGDILITGYTNLDTTNWGSLPASGTTWADFDTNSVVSTFFGGYNLTFPPGVTNSLSGLYTAGLPFGDTTIGTGASRRVAIQGSATNNTILDIGTSSCYYTDFRYVTSVNPIYTISGSVSSSSNVYSIPIPSGGGGGSYTWVN